MDQIIITEPLEVPLTEPELKAASKMLADAVRKKVSIESEVASFKAEKKGELTKCDEIIKRCTDSINSEREYRMVECEVRFNWSTNVKSIVRMDTGEEIRSLPISNAERQQYFAAA